MIAPGTVVAMRSEDSPEPGRLKRELSLLVETVKEASHDHAKDLAAAIAFWAFFSIFPLLIGILSLAGYLLQSAELQARIYEVVTDMFPGSASLVRDNLDAVVQYRGTMSWVGIGGLLWTASKGFGAITRAVNRALGAERTDNFLLSRIRNFFMVVAVSVLMIASIAITVALEIALDPSFLSRLGLDAVNLPRLQGWTANFVLVFLIFALIYKLAPYVEVRWRQVLPGALLAAALFELVKSVFVVYLDRIADFEAVYGSLSSIIVLLLWLYLSAVILIYGAEYSIVRSQASEAAAETEPGGAE
jgi:membrane protein